jgi:hypothetical protein
MILWQLEHKTAKSSSVVVADSDDADSGTKW